MGTNPKSGGCQVDFTMYRLDMGYETGEDRLLLWLPAVAKHVITEDSPLRGWRQPGGRLKDANATILVEVLLSYLL